jgi:hypothetical protein
MYDTLTTRYRFSCPRLGVTSVLLSGFRCLEELPGAHHPSVYRVEFACRCGETHVALVPHSELDWAPLGFDEQRTFVNFMTSQRDPLADELASLAAARIKAGEWPWSFFCWPEERPRQAFPSAFRLLADSANDKRVALAVRCPDCGLLSVNLVSHAHIDFPFHNDTAVGVVTHRFADDLAGRRRLLPEDFEGVGFEERRLVAGRR